MYDVVNKNFNLLIKKLTKNNSIDTSILEINVTEILRHRVILRSAKEINETQYSILGDLKIQVEQYQKYKYDPILDKIQSIINYYNKQTLKSSDSSSDEFLKNIQNLSITSKESIVNADKFNDFSRYVHIKRNIEDTLFDECSTLSKNESGLILLVGSVGDGKSHLLAYLKDKSPELFENIIIHNDATESSHPSQTASETLEYKLKDVYENNRKIIIAINIGMLHNFYSYLQDRSSLSNFRKFIDESGILNTNVELENEDTSHNFPDHSIVSFLNEQTIKIVDGKIENDFYSRLISKIFSKSSDNPIYQAFINDDGFNRREIIYKNYSLLLNQKIQNSIVHLLNLIQIQDKRILTARSVLNFLYDIIVPTEIDKNSHSDFIPFLLFENKGKSKILESISRHDPSHTMINKFEMLNMRIYNTDDLPAYCKKVFKDDYELIESTILYLSGLDSKNHPKKYRTVLRLYFLLNHEEFITEDYIKYLKVLEKKDNASVKSFIKNVQYAIYHWNGSPKENFLYKKPWNSSDNIRLAIEFVCKFKSIYISNNSIFLSIYNEQENNTMERPYELEIDYPLFILIEKIAAGYMIKNQDRHDAINFNEFIENIIENTTSMQSTIIKSNISNRLFLVSSSIMSPEIKELN